MQEPALWRQIHPGVQTKILDGAFEWRPGDRGFRAVDMLVKCRSCDVCLRERAAKWRVRAAAEIEWSARTWMGTLTLNPAASYRLDLAAMHHARERSVDLSALSAEEAFNRKVIEFGREITLFLKRVRKESGAPLRYLVVFEQHKSGQPHAHALIHEVTVDHPVRHALLGRQWRLGFSHFKLADKAASGYVAKYLSKSMLARVRASLRYGLRPES